MVIKYYWVSVKFKPGVKYLYLSVSSIGEIHDAIGCNLTGGHEAMFSFGREENYKGFIKDLEGLDFIESAYLNRASERKI
jgi:hypothetical protein